MSFLYPLFLIAGLALAIPVLIHLFNLRRYKTVLFPHTRFLKSIQLKSQKQSQLKYKWLLALRLLFLGLLILAFAQPFLNGGSKKDAGNRLQVLYIDNSGSMGVKDGARNLFEMARDAARKQVQQSAPGTRFLLLTNDKLVSYQPLPADKILAELNRIELSANSKPAAKLLSTVQSIMQSEAVQGADVYYYSDFQRSAFPANPDASLLKNTRFYGIPMQSDAAANVFVDTAYLDAPVLQTGQQNKLIVHSRIEGKTKEAPVLQLTINGQVKTAAQLNFGDNNESIDTLAFDVNGTGWQQMQLTVNDASVRFDDTFRIAARSTPSLSVLVLNGGQPNPYIQAAFNANSGFQVEQRQFSSDIDLSRYNLVIIEGVTNFSPSYGKIAADALDKGLSVCIFPGRTNDINALNEGLKQIADIRITGVDTAAQAAGTLQQGSDLVKDMFERIPENVQLPTANWHYTIQAGLSANEQSVLSFRNGDPFLAKYTPTRGQLYISATAADMESGNFTGSYFFVPFLYQMAMQSGGSSTYALTLGKEQPAFLPIQSGERNMIHLYGNGIDAIPPQRPAGTGVEVFADKAVQQPGFYRLYAAGSDTATIALNTDRVESQLQVWTPAQLKKQWGGDSIKWLEAGDMATAKNTAVLGSFPLWKVCAILALLMLAAETFVLAGGLRKKTIEGRPADTITQ